SNKIRFKSVKHVIYNEYFLDEFIVYLFKEKNSVK
ncbi:unnamed protein product, partial [marine sediment metagenome]